MYHKFEQLLHSALKFMKNSKLLVCEQKFDLLKTCKDASKILLKQATKGFKFILYTLYKAG